MSDGTRDDARLLALPIPAGATADDWLDPVNATDQVGRSLTWSSHDAARVGITVDGWQYASGLFDRYVSLYDTDHKLSAADARQLAAALIQAADALDGLR